jgi:hypothetical protein
MAIGSSPDTTQYVPRRAKSSDCTNPLVTSYVYQVFVECVDGRTGCCACNVMALFFSRNIEHFKACVRALETSIRV